MITVHSSVNRELMGLSTDEKPTGVSENMLFLELDTGKFYYFTGIEWVEVGTSGGGDGIFIVEVTNNEGSFVFNKTFDETMNAYENGSFVCMFLNEQGYRRYLFLEEAEIEEPGYLTFERTRADLLFNEQDNDEMKDIASIYKELFQWLSDGTYQYVQGQKMFV